MESGLITLLNDRLAIILAALLLNALLAGPPTWLALAQLNKPRQGLLKLYRLGENKLNRQRRDAKTRKFRGMLLAGLTLVAGIGIGGVLMWLLDSFYLGELIEILLVSGMIGLRQTFDLAYISEKALRASDEETPRHLLSLFGWKNASVLDAHSLSRAPVETLAVHFGERVLAPVFFYFLFGLPGAVAIYLFSILMETLTRESEEFRHTPEKIFYGLQFLPMHLVCFLFCLAATLHPVAQPRLAFRRWQSETQASDHRARLLATFGAAFNLSLGGPVSPYCEHWVGGETAKATPEHLRHATQLYALSAALLFLLLGAVFLA